MAVSVIGMGKAKIQSQKSKTTFCDILSLVRVYDPCRTVVGNNVGKAGKDRIIGSLEC